MSPFPFLSAAEVALREGENWVWILKFRSAGNFSVCYTEVSQRQSLLFWLFLWLLEALCLSTSYPAMLEADAGSTGLLRDALRRLGCGRSIFQHPLSDVAYSTRILCQIFSKQAVKGVMLELLLHYIPSGRRTGPGVQMWLVSGESFQPLRFPAVTGSYCS